MVSLFTQTPEFYNDLCEVIRLFCDEKHIARLDEDEIPNEGMAVRHFFRRDETGWHSAVFLYIDGTLQTETRSNPDFFDARSGNAVDPGQDTLLAKRNKKHHNKHLLYTALRDYFGREFPWGSLTGIRPTKLLRDLQQRYGKQEGLDVFCERYLVQGSKAGLAATIVDVQESRIADRSDDDVDLYIGIPFCTSRCKYCSFISHDLKRSEALKKRYLPQLMAEMEGMRETLKRYSVRAVYVGGGTPTALAAEELDSLLRAVAEWFPGVLEFTVEAGRPDTIDEEKLEVIRKSGADRISINAQTTNDETLRRIGRGHGKDDFFRAFELARQYGFRTINTDLILGLPGETEADVERTLRDVLRLRPENITVHTLAVKNASEFARERREDLPSGEIAERMVEASQQFLLQKGYLPYYLYRQKYMSGNLENVGFTLPGHEGIYNIDIMEETVSNMAFGAGGISKRIFPEEKRIERAANVKDVSQYLDRTKEMIERKKGLFGAERSG